MLYSEAEFQDPVAGLVLGKIFRIVIVDDFAPWRDFVRSLIQRQPDLHIIGEASNGLAAVEVTQELQPDLVLLDIALPQLNGMEAARRIRQCAPKVKILFLSGICSWEVVSETLRTGAYGYVAKADVGDELLTAVTAVLQGEKFIGNRFAGHDFD